MMGSTTFPENFPGTRMTVQEAHFKTRFRDKTIIPRITNGDYKGRFVRKGTEIEIPVLPLIQTHATRPGEKVRYQKPQGAKEVFTIGRERYFAFKIEDEDRLFSPLDIDGACAQEGTRQMAEDVEAEFFADVFAKCHAKNQGNGAGIRSGGYDLGNATTPQTLYRARADFPSQTENCQAVADYLVGCINCLNEMPGGMDTDPYIVIPVAVANILQTSELKRADWMGDAESVLRRGVRYLGRLNGCDVIVDNQTPVWKGAATADTKYLVLFGDQSAVTFADEAKISGGAMESTEEWGRFYRTKLIYDWFVRYPERLGAGIVKIG